jgi:hypothetical protein
MINTVSYYRVKGINMAVKKMAGKICGAGIKKYPGIYIRTNRIYNKDRGRV